MKPPLSNDAEPDRAADPQTTPRPFRPMWGRSMHRSYGLFLRLTFGRLTARLTLDAETLEAIRSLAKTHTITYVMPTASLLDYLLMNALLLQRDLPLARFANDVPMLWFQPPAVAYEALLQRIRALLRRPSLRAREESRHVIDTLSHGHSVLMFLNKSGLFSKPTRWKVLVWEELVRAERREKCKTALVPIAIMWGRQAGRLRRSLIDILFGDTDAPGFLRKAILFLRHSQNFTVRIGQPMDVRQALEEVKPGRDEIHAKKLRRLLSSYLYRERKLLTGPPIRSRERIVRTLLKDPELGKLVAGVARREKKGQKAIWKRAEEILWEMIADYHPTHVAISHRVFRWLWDRLYDALHVDEEGFEEFRKISRDYPVVLVPSHKSHIDYVLLSGILYERGMMPPHIAAGINLKFWPMGWIFRRNGAFFIRRSISGDLLYAKLLALYVRWLIRTGYSQEFFIEGGRTRTGKLVFPKHGLLSLQADAALNSPIKDLYIVPIAVTYERVLEEGAYREELSGHQKKKETLGAIFRSRKLIRRQYGAGYVRFSKPISVRQYFGVKIGEKIPNKVRREKAVQLAHEITREIASQTVVTTTALTTCVLLAQRERGIIDSALRKKLRLLVDYLHETNAHLSPEVQNIDQHLRHIISFFTDNYWMVSAGGSENDQLLITLEEKRLTLDFYKNTVLYFFLPGALVAAALQADDTDRNLEGDISFLQDIFAYEFFLPRRESAADIIRRERPRVEDPGDRSRRKLFAGLIQNYLEAYDLAACLALRSPIPFPPSSGVLRNGIAFGNRLFATGAITHPEAISSANLRSALTYFHGRGLLVDTTALQLWHNHLKRFLE